MIILKQLNGKAIWLLDTLSQDSIEKKLAILAVFYCICKFCTL